MDKPSYYRLYRDVWEPIRDTLPPAQGAKLLYAMVSLFFDDVEPKAGALPKSAQAIYDIQRAAIRNYRRNALNGAKNSPKVAQRTQGKHDKEPRPVLEPKAGMKTDGSFRTVTEELPVDSHEAGTHPDPNPSPNPNQMVGQDLGANNSNQESRSNNQPTGAGGAFSTPRPARAVSVTHKKSRSKGNVAAMGEVPSFEEWSSLNERLLAAGDSYHEELTDDEISRYRAGYQVYRQGRLSEQT